MADKTLEYLIRLGIDPGTAAKASEEVKQLKSQVTQLDAEANKAGKSLLKTTEEAFNNARALNVGGRAGSVLVGASESLSGLGLSGPANALRGIGDIGKLSGYVEKITTDIS